jgi:hypothetical protein
VVGGDVRLKVPLELTKEQSDKLVGRALSLGYMRVEPRRTWTESERKDAIRFLVRAMLSELVGPIVL